jgi:hypothetical protein
MPEKFHDVRPEGHQAARRGDVPERRLHPECELANPAGENEGRDVGKRQDGVDVRRPDG